MTKGGKILKGILIVLLFIGLLVAVGFANHKQNNQKITGFTVKVDALKGDAFMTDQAFKALIYSKLDTFVGLKTKQVSISQIEALAKKEVSVKSASAFFGVNGEVFLELELKTVFARVKPVSSGGYYIDSDGKIMPWVSTFTPSVLTITGWLERYPRYNPVKDSVKTVNKRLINEAYEFASYVHSSEFWSSQLVQVFINKEGDAELITLLGGQKIIFGELSNSKEKLDKLMLFYQEIVQKVGWYKYKEVNLKFNKQIVCKK